MTPLGDRKVVAIVQARVGSTRLPGKVLMPAAGKPLLAHLIERLRRAKLVDRIVVATTDNPADDPIVELCSLIDVDHFRGSEFDCLDRYTQTARAFNADVVVRITSDCPLIDPVVVDELIHFALHDGRQWDLITNRHPLTYPDGLDVDVIPRPSLERAWREATTPSQREHTIPYFWEAGLRVHNFEDPRHLFWKHRWTLDYPEDYQLIREVFEHLYPANPAFTCDAILDFLAGRPDLVKLNSRYIPPKLD